MIKFDKVYHDTGRGFKVCRQVFDRSEGNIPTIYDLEPEYIISEKNIIDELLGDGGQMRHEMDAAHNAIIRKKLELLQSIVEPDALINCSDSNNDDFFCVEAVESKNIIKQEEVLIRNSIKECNSRKASIRDNNYRNILIRFLYDLIPTVDERRKTILNEIKKEERAFREIERAYLKRKEDLESELKNFDTEVRNATIAKINYANHCGTVIDNPDKLYYCYSSSIVQTLLELINACESFDKKKDSSPEEISRMKSKRESSSIIKKHAELKGCDDLRAFRSGIRKSKLSY